MKIFVAAVLLLGGLLTTSVAQAQISATPFTGDAPRRDAPKKRKASNEDVGRMQQRMNMNAREAKRDEQMEVLEARAGGSSYASGSAVGRHYEKGSGAFTVRKFRGDKRNAAMQKRGQTRPAPGIDPKGKPLNHKKKYRKNFLF
jgi:hypothetical protein